MHIYISCATILQSFIKIDQAFLEEMCSQSYSDGRTHLPLLCLSVASRRGTKRVYGLNIYTFIQTRNNRVQTYGWPTLGQTDLRTNATEPVLIIHTWPVTDNFIWFSFLELHKQKREFEILVTLLWGVLVLHDIKSPNRTDTILALPNFDNVTTYWLMSRFP
jgi:hypothetical protein